MSPKDMQSFLPTESVAQIHRTSMQLLENVGVDFPCPAALAVFRRHGVRTDGSLVHLTEAQLLKALETVPRQFIVQARNPALNVTVGAGRTVFAPGYGAPFLVDAVEGVRGPTMTDYHTLVKLAHALPNQDMRISPCRAGDVSRGSTFGCSCPHRTRIRPSWHRQASAALGIRWRNRSCSGDLRTNSEPDRSLTPLRYSSEMLEALVAYADAPATDHRSAGDGRFDCSVLAGVLALQNAELLAAWRHN
jgi:trimethylamine:corrinoid methyltransferase-like protein